MERTIDMTRITGCLVWIAIFSGSGTVAQNVRADSLFLYRLTLSEHYQKSENWTEDAWRTIQIHADFLDSLGRAGIVIFAGRTLRPPGNPQLFGIAVFYAPTLRDAELLMQRDPAVAAGIQRMEVMPFSMGIRHFKNVRE